MAKFSKKKNSVPKSRKELRKDKRKEKKQRKFDSYVNRNKPGKFVLMNKNAVDGKKFIDPVKPINKGKDAKSVKFVDIPVKERKAEKDMQKRLQKEMSKQRRKQLKEANLEEDRNIKQLEKQLKLNKKKTASISKSFSSDGLDYLLELCETDNMKSIAAAEQQFAELNDEFEDDFALATEGISVKNKKDDNDSDDLISNDSEIDENLDDEFSNHSESPDFESEDETIIKNLKEKQNKKNSKKKQLEKSKRKNTVDESNNNIKNKKQKLNKVDSSEEDESENEFKNDDSDADIAINDSEIEDERTKVWEDIYGRKRDKQGAVITEKIKGKYVPPALRGLQAIGASVDQKHAEKLARLRKLLKGLLNRLAESNMHNIASQIEEMYMSNSRNDMNETLTQLIFDSLIAPVLSPERLLLEHMLLITILHANVGTEVGAHFLQTIVKKFDELFKKNQEVENKELDNTVHTIAQLYNYKVFHSQLLYQILAKLGEKFEEKHVECILLVLKNVGFSLRKDDPLALKQLILDMQKKAATVTNKDSRVKYMLDILLAIKNNNVTKIPNYDTTYSEHLKKILKGFIRKGNYVTQLNISLEDLLKADERGRWWIVGSAWTGVEEKSKDNKSTETAPSYNQKLLELARKQRMNTDTRRNIFCSLMTAENYTDAFEKILSIGLKGQQEREIIHVLLHCSMQEKDYNPYYTLLAQKFCEYDRKYQMMLRCSIWDKLKALTECTGKQIAIFAKLLTHLFLNEGLPISTLKIIQFSELDQVTLRLIRQVLLGILLHQHEEATLAVFQKIAMTPKLKMFRESLRLFVHHFLLRNLSASELSEENKNLLTSRAKLIDQALSVHESKIKF